MIYILYDTSPYFEKHIGEEFFCKSMTSAKHILKRELKASVERGEITKDCMKEALKKFETWIFDKKTCWNVGDLQIDTSIDDLQIWIKEIKLV